MSRNDPPNQNNDNGEWTMNEAKNEEKRNGQADPLETVAGWLRILNATPTGVAPALPLPVVAALGAAGWKLYRWLGKR